ncbi:MAG: DUF5067 domain-containing protein [Eubacterium sp.]|nr:DUF5067 domain-containing protein [Eubacterium sp.]
MENNNFEVQQAVSAAMAEQKKKKRKKRLIILGVIVLLIIIGIAIGSSGGNDEKETTTAAQVTVSQNDNNVSSDVEAEEDEKTDGTIGDYVCIVKKAKICKNWEGKDAVKITYYFTNNSKEAASFDIALSDEVYQDDIQLESTFISSDDDDWGVDVKIKPGKTKEVSKVYLLRDKKTDLEVEISELISFNDDKLVTTVKLEK